MNLPDKEYLRLLVSLLLLFLSGCSLAPQSQQLIQEHKSGQNGQLELVEVPFFAQDDYQCGPAALSTVLVNNGIVIKPQDLTGRVYLPKRQGSIQIEMVAAARSFGMLVHPLKPTLKSIISQLQAGYPVLVLQNLGLDWIPRWHYAVVVGYDMNKAIFILRSGVHKRVYTKFSTFERTWARGNYWGIVVLPPEKVPAEVEYLKYLTAIQPLEAIGRFKVAYQGYQQAHHLWPEQELPLIGMGNSAYSQKAYLVAAQAFEKATRVNPESGQAWNNFAYALKELNCGQEALIAIKTALSLSGSNETFQNSFEEIKAYATTAAQKGCQFISE